MYITETCRQYGYGIKALEVMPDHIHLFADLPHTTAPAEAIRILKSLTARKLFLVYPQLKTFYKRAGCLWPRGYFVSSVGHVSEDTVRRYIEEQQR